MPFLPFVNTPIVVDVCDVVFGDTLVKQRATWLGLTIDVNPDSKELGVIIKTRVELWSSLDGGYGEPIPPSRAFRAREVLLHANNNCAVYLNPADENDPRNGQVCYYRAPGSPFGWQRVNLATNALEDLTAPLEEAPEPLLKQGDSFALLLTQEVKHHALIERNIRQADGPGFNRFAL